MYTHRVKAQLVKPTVGLNLAVYIYPKPKIGPYRCKKG